MPVSPGKTPAAAGGGGDIMHELTRLRNELRLKDSQLEEKMVGSTLALSTAIHTHQRGTVTRPGACCWAGASNTARTLEVDPWHTSARVHAAAAVCRSTP